MTSRDFCYWLQGFFEIVGGANPLVDTGNSLTTVQIDIIKKHLALVFVHEIDPSAGDKKHQEVLNDIHNTVAPPFGRVGPDGVVYRC